MPNNTGNEKDRPREDAAREDDQILGDTSKESNSKSESAPDSARTGRPIIGEGKSDE